MKLLRVFFLLMLFGGPVVFSAGKNVGGYVFHDINQNGIKDAGEPGIDGVCVSNGEVVVRSGADGKWALEDSGSSALFVIKPAGYRVPVNREMIPQHFFLLKGETPEHGINFPLIATAENREFTAIFFGDPQARGLKEVNYINHDVVEELIGTDALFGVSLGDITADGPALFQAINQGIAQIGIPWYNTFGNHDYDRNTPDNRGKTATYEQVYGPSTYAFEYGEVAFIDFNNIHFTPDGRYTSRFSEQQLNFVENYLAWVPAGKLVVLMMHVPVVVCENRERLLALISNRKHTFSVSGHAHEQINLFVGPEMGWKGAGEHHHLVNGAVCGSWWCGALDEVNIPHATMNDGTPNGYSVIHFSGNSYRVRFKAARRPENYQMNIYLADDVILSDRQSRQVLVNVFAGSPRSVVEMQLSGEEQWLKMEPAEVPDPECARMHDLNPFLQEKVNGKVLEEVLGYLMDKPSISPHIWRGELPQNLLPGTYTLKVRTTDQFGQTWTSARVFRVSAKL